MRKLFLLCIVCIAFADVPALINYQGKIADADGLPVEGELSITFRIYDAASGGSSLWEEAQTVMVLNGVYNTLLGSVSAFDEDLFDGAERYLSIQVGDDEESSSRSQLVSTPYAMNAKYFDGMTQEEVVHYRDDGFVVLEDFLDPKELDDWRSAFDEAILLRGKDKVPRGEEDWPE